MTIGFLRAGACAALLSFFALSVSWAAGLTIEHARARIVPGPAKTGAVYLTIVNATSQLDRLVAVSTPVATKASLHMVSEDNGIMKMRPVDGVEAEPGRTELKPGSLHIMLTGLTKSLKEGDSFPLALIFDKAGTVEAKVKVEKLGAKGDHGH